MVGDGDSMEPLMSGLQNEAERREYAIAEMAMDVKVRLYNLVCATLRQWKKKRGIRDCAGDSAKNYES